MNIKQATYKAIRRAAMLTLPLLGGVGGSLALSSCDDFLSILPQNEIVLENYWTEEADVNSVLNSCYSQLQSADCVQRMVVWGELRSDNIEAGASTDNSILQILKGNLLETNKFANWHPFYVVINRCNTVMHYAPGVADYDPNFTQSELRATMAEAMTLRSLCYFYLIRTFRDVPYVTEPSLEDDQQYKVPPTKFDALLDSLIRDVESVKDDAVRSYGEDSEENTCRITRWACYSLLADLYLWKGDYAKCIEYCDLVIDRKREEYEEDRMKNPTSITTMLYGNKYPLIAESVQNGSELGNAYNEIFGDGDSFESIFELRFIQNSGATNSAVNTYYGNSSDSYGQMAVPSYFSEGVDNGTNEYFTRTDCRFYENFLTSSSKTYIQKYVNEYITFRKLAGSNLPTPTCRVRSDQANWIIYRLTDVMLMRAEAEVELAGDINPGMEKTEEQIAHYRNAFSSVKAVWHRANEKMLTSVRDTIVFDDYASSRVDMENLVLGERQRELMFEGKRWFDLVRLCRRDGENSRMIEKVLAKFKQDQAAIRIRLASQDALYFPYYRDELKANSFLTQNPAYKTSDNFELN